MGGTRIGRHPRPLAQALRPFSGAAKPHLLSKDDFIGKNPGLKLVHQRTLGDGIYPPVKPKGELTGSDIPKLLKDEDFATIKAMILNLKEKPELVSSLLQQLAGIDFQKHDCEDLVVLLHSQVQACTLSSLNYSYLLRHACQHKQKLVAQLIMESTLFGVALDEQTCLMLSLWTQVDVMARKGITFNEKNQLHNWLQMILQSTKDEQSQDYIRGMCQAIAKPSSLNQTQPQQQTGRRT